MPEVPGAALGESPVAVIDIVVVIFMKIVANINIIPAVVVQVGNRNAKTVSKAALINASLCGDVREPVSRRIQVISIKAIARTAVHAVAEKRVDNIFVGPV